jgi:hypothetical protein
MLTVLKIVAIMLSVSVVVIAAYLWVVFSIVPDLDLRMRLKTITAVVFGLAVLALIALSTSAGAQERPLNPYGWNIPQQAEPETRELPERRTIFDRCSMAAVVRSHHRAPPQEQPTSALQTEQSYLAGCFEQGEP